MAASLNQLFMQLTVFLVRIVLNRPRVVSVCIVCRVESPPAVVDVVTLELLRDAVSAVPPAQESLGPLAVSLGVPSHRNAPHLRPHGLEAFRSHRLRRNQKTEGNNFVLKGATKKLWMFSHSR